MDREDIEKILGVSLVKESLIKEAEAAKKAGAVGYMARAMVQATLPHKSTPGSEFHRENGLFSLTILAPSKIGLPYGSTPRLLLAWMTTEALYTRSPVLELGPTLSAFLAELGLGRTGGAKGDITRLKKQIIRLFSSSISCSYQDDASAQGAAFTIAEEYSLWWTPKAPDQTALWKSTVTLGNKFFKEVIERPVPIDMAALKALKRSPMELDIYFWLTYRMSYLQRDMLIPWPLLQMQFGADYSLEGQGPRDFKRNFLLRLKKVLSVYDTAKVGGMEKGLLLKPSPPHVAKRPIAMLPGSRRRPAISGAAEFLAPALMGEQRITLDPETFHKAREAMGENRLDVYVLEQEWRDWIAKKGEMPKNPDKAFIGFCRKKAQRGSI